LIQASPESPGIGKSSIVCPAPVFPYAYSLMMVPMKKQHYVIHKVHGVSGTFKDLKDLTNNVFKDIFLAAYGLRMLSQAMGQKDCK